MMTMMTMMIILYRRRRRRPTTPPDQMLLSEVRHGRNAEGQGAAKARRTKRPPEAASFTNFSLFLSFVK
jgi:hypothetical protein